jgi:predicted RNA binding protein YcfA (HicA-like mRNA interferase family)
VNGLRKGVNARQLIAALQADGFQLQRVRGSHRVYRRQDGRRVIVAAHRLSDTFPIGTLRAMIEDAGWSEHDFERLGLG